MRDDADLDEARCSSAGCANAGTAPHPCPFLEEIKGDAETTCNCCEGCQEECARDI